MTIYEVLGDEALAPRNLRNGRGVLEGARRLHAARTGVRRWTAFEAFLKRWPDDGPAEVFRARCEEYLAEEPPADWDGVYVMKHK